MRQTLKRCRVRANWDFPYISIYIWIFPECGVALYSNLCYNLHMLTKKKKQNVMKGVARDEKDTGSPEVQIGLLTRRINELATHLKKNPKDIHSRRGLLGMVADRRAHLKYLERKNKRAYNALLKKLDLKR